MSNYRIRMMDKHWAAFLKYIKSYDSHGTSAGGVFGRIDTATGMDITENSKLIPSETNFWIWFTDYKLSAPKQPRNKT